MQGARVASPLYDAALHAVFVGFVMAMIFGHAPIIFPAILGKQIHYRSNFYAHLGLLHFSLAMRSVGNLLNVYELRRWCGLLNEIAILLFGGMTVFSLLREEKKKTPAG